MCQNKMKSIIYLIILMYIPLFLVFMGNINVTPIISLLLSILLITIIFYTKLIKVRRRIQLLLSISAVIIATISLIFSTFFTVMWSSGDSMTPVLKEGSYRFVWQQDFNIKNGDIVVAYAPKSNNVNEKHKVFKTVAAQQEDKIDFYLYGNTTKMVVNNDLEIWIFTNTMEIMLEHIDTNGIIKSDVIFLIGENLETSYDGRDYGFIPKEDVLGKVLFEF